MEVENELQVSNQGRTLIKEWDRLAKEVKNQRGYLNSTECAFLNARNELYKWFVPKDAVKGQIYVLAVGAGFLEAIGGDENSVKWREYPIRGF